MFASTKNIGPAVFVSPGNRFLAPGIRDCYSGSVIRIDNLLETARQKYFNSKIQLEIQLEILTRRQPQT